MSAIKSFTTRRVVYKRAFAEGQDRTGRQEFRMLYRIKAKVSDTHHHMDPLPRFLFLVISASDAYTAIESTASNIQDLIFQRVCLDLYGVSKEKKKNLPVVLISPRFGSKHRAPIVSLNEHLALYSEPSSNFANRTHGIVRSRFQC